jgi:signal transduction histidine kinase
LCAEKGSVPSLFGLHQINNFNYRKRVYLYLIERRIGFVQTICSGLHCFVMVDAILAAGKARILLAVCCLMAVIAFTDRAVGNTSLGPLYMLPMVLGAVVLGRIETAALALFCAFLRSRFDVPSAQPEAILRFVFAAFSYFACGLFVIALVRNRRFVREHLRLMGEHVTTAEKEQELRREAEEQLRALVAGSPAGILTTDSSGKVLAANDAANSLFAIPAGETLAGRAILDYLPVLSDALQLNGAPEGFRTAAQCQGRRANGDIFPAHTWFSSWAAPDGTRLAAIVVDSSEEMRDREEQNLRLLQKSNRITAAAVSHELRTLCGAISLVSSHLKDKPMQDARHLEEDADFQSLVHLVRGMEKLANLELLARSSEAGDLAGVPLQRVLDDLRIVIESEWQRIDGLIRWRVPEKLPLVLAEAHGLLQAFLNLVQNSHRAVQEGSVRELDIAVSVGDTKAVIRFHDSGPGIAFPERLFQPFQHAAEGTGLGLYVSRAVVRSYGGDLRLEPWPQGAGCCFAIELQVA